MIKLAVRVTRDTGADQAGVGVLEWGGQLEREVGSDWPVTDDRGARETASRAWTKYYVMRGVAP